MFELSSGMRKNQIKNKAEIVLNRHRQTLNLDFKYKVYVIKTLEKVESGIYCSEVLASSKTLSLIKLCDTEIEKLKMGLYGLVNE